jgi:GNAT superfamily N-acetyltransferase
MRPGLVCEAGPGKRCGRIRGVIGQDGGTGSDRAAQGGHVIRQAGPADLDAIAGFEVDIARVSFGDEAITDAEFHRRRVAGALGKAGEIALVAVARENPDTPLGWAWMSARTNSLTGERYGNFRSLAVADVPVRGLIGEQLMAAILAAADEAGFTHLSGKVNAANVGMRALYRAFGFTATHLTMEKRSIAGRGLAGNDAKRATGEVR